MTVIYLNRARILMFLLFSPFFVAVRHFQDALTVNAYSFSDNYMKLRIKDPWRISGKGYGESKILNGCACEGRKQPKYTEAQHAVNRRAEFLVVKI